MNSPNLNKQNEQRTDTDWYLFLPVWYLPVCPSRGEQPGPQPTHRKMPISRFGLVSGSASCTSCSWTSGSAADDVMVLLMSLSLSPIDTESCSSPFSLLHTWFGGDKSGYRINPPETCYGAELLWLRFFSRWTRISSLLNLCLFMNLSENNAIVFPFGAQMQRPWFKVWSD